MSSRYILMGIGGIIITGLFIFFLVKIINYIRNKNSVTPDNGSGGGGGDGGGCIKCGNICCNTGEYCGNDASGNSVCCKKALCDGICCNLNNGETCQPTINGNNICCKKPLCGYSCCNDGENCGKDKNGNNICCKKALCGELCCDDGENCGKDKYGNNVCCKKSLCNGICCDSDNGETCQINGECCKDGLFGVDEKNNNVCCKKALCDGICCDDNKICDPDTKTCIVCPSTHVSCNGICCDMGQTCHKGIDGKDYCCDKDICGTICCKSTESCYKGADGKDYCCETDLLHGNICCKKGQTYIDSGLCCDSNNICIDENGTSVCYDENLCTIDPNTKKCVCCKNGEKYDITSGTCKIICGNELCNKDKNIQYCFSQDADKPHCINVGCSWGQYQYHPSLVDNDIKICSYNNKLYTVNNPVGVNPLLLTRTSSVLQGANSQIDCTPDDCRMKILEDNMDFANYDTATKLCTATFDCGKNLPQNNGTCPLPNSVSCCFDENGKYTGQICSNGRRCYKGECVCNNDADKGDNCIRIDGSTNCNGNGTIIFKDNNNFNCKCNPTFAGTECEYGRNICSNNGNPNDNKTCNCDTGFTGNICQYSRSTCSGHGTPNYDGTCVCDTSFTGNICQYTRNGTCSGHGTPNYDGTCICDGIDKLNDINNFDPKGIYKWNGTTCGPLKWYEFYDCKRIKNHVYGWLNSYLPGSNQTVKQYIQNTDFIKDAYNGLGGWSCFIVFQVNIQNYPHNYNITNWSKRTDSDGGWDDFLNTDQYGNVRTMFGSTPIYDQNSNSTTRMYVYANKDPAGLPGGQIKCVVNNYDVIGVQWDSNSTSTTLLPETCAWMKNNGISGYLIQSGGFMPSISPNCQIMDGSNCPDLLDDSPAIFVFNDAKVDTLLP